MTTSRFEATVPVLRVFCLRRAREFYLRFLGFTLDWEQRAAEGAPGYLQVSRQGLVLHLSEHHGDGCPGAVVLVRTAGLDALQRELLARDYPFLRPGIEVVPLGRVMEVIDPFGNRIRFTEAA